MKILIVAPVEVGSGETITALHIADQLYANGDNVHLIVSKHAQRFIGTSFPGAISNFTDDGVANRTLWDKVIFEYQPEVILFADYPLLFFTNGVSSIAKIDEWASSLEQLDARLMTLDHTGFAQFGQGVFFGPAHLSFHYEKWPDIPQRMEVLLPCPMQEPSNIPDRKGQPFRYWNVPFKPSETERQAIRNKYLDGKDGYLVFHSVARWAWESAELLQLPYYSYLPKILDYYFKGCDKPVTLISVNDRNLLSATQSDNIKIINSGDLPKEEYNNLLFSADLMLTENGISISLGKAICGLLPCINLRNSYTYRALLEKTSGEMRELAKRMETKRAGAIYPYEMFPGGSVEWLDKLGLYHNNTILSCFERLEVYGGIETRHKLHALLSNPVERKNLQKKQQAYIDKIQSLPTVYEILHNTIL